MFSPELMRFLVGKDVEEHLPKSEKVVVKKSDKDGVYRYKRYVTVPIEIQNK